MAPIPRAYPERCTPSSAKRSLSQCVPREHLSAELILNTNGANLRAAASPRTACAEHCLPVGIKLCIVAAHFHCGQFSSRPKIIARFSFVRMHASVHEHMRTHARAHVCRRTPNPMDAELVGSAVPGRIPAKRQPLPPLYTENTVLF